MQPPGTYLGMPLARVEAEAAWKEPLAKWRRRVGDMVALSMQLLQPRRAMGVVFFRTCST